MAETWFIEAEYVKEKSIINENVDEKLLKRTIEKAQDIHLKAVIGSTLYDEIEGEIDGGTVTALNTTLLEEYLHPFLVAQCEWLMPVHILYKMTNKSVSKESSQYGTPLTSQEVKELRAELKQSAEYYATRITKYLQENEDDYPNYCPSEVNCDTILPDKENYDTGIYLG